MRQQLSATARRDKAARDKAYAMTPARKAKKAHSQRKRSAAKKAGQNIDGQDYDHKRQQFVSVKSNRGNEGIGTQSESGNNYNTV
jgi:hypothetical protein|tara:strand:+ start:925 stop:1179 length:255 start_codon:yes stop_codon:yes gene_type:complete